MSEQAVKNTDRELWREIEGDHYAPSIFVNDGGGIGINVGGLVFVKSLRDWHSLAKPGYEPAAPEAGNDHEVPPQKRRKIALTDTPANRILAAKLSGRQSEPHPVSAEPRQLVKNRETDTGKIFWDHVESLMAQSVEPEKRPEESDDYRPTRESLSNSEVRSTGILCGGAVHNIARELLALRTENARLEKELGMLREELRKHVNAALANAAKLEGK